MMLAPRGRPGSVQALVALTSLTFVTLLVHPAKVDPHTVDELTRDQGDAALTPLKTLRSGRTIPRLGFGTGGRTDGVRRYEEVRLALREGVRLIDTAAAYGDEDVVGKAMRDSGVAREQVWLTTKLPWINASYEQTIAELKSSLTRLGVDYVDMYLIHTPLYRATRVEQWRALLHARTTGLVREVGVSNYGMQHLAEIEAAGLELPALNQVEVHPWLPQKELLDYCSKRGVAVQAYGPLGVIKRWGDDPLPAIAARHGVSVPQVLLRWGLQNGLLPLFGSASPGHVAADADIFDFKLDAADMAKMAQLSNGKPLHIYPSSKADRLP
jgi:diketogulonate reductase-like aldo/keto reductase